MKVRAEASEATGQHILEVAQQLFGEMLYDHVSLQEVADRAEVSVQTVIRHFTSKEQLFTAVTQWSSRQIRAGRDQAPVGDVTGAVRNLIDCYEQWGDHVLNCLAQEQRTPALREVTDAGRRYHHAWVKRTLGLLLADISASECTQHLNQLVAVTDMYMWKVLRRDLGLSRNETEMAVRSLVNRIIGNG